ncbi:hypothetical protein BNJ_00211 [Kaumoebavirus]|uniref:hypothetical protein n=1 Tax=Kaumoebavirus TaxID=1859492 RepID=UPI0009C20642|nr:hypothetical protein BNJ_00211 [Kaumoebavirus]ARA72040.1 hypothetical protein BNJ_00211 [Kaumoebavirus]
MDQKIFNRLCDAFPYLSMEMIKNHSGRSVIVIKKPYSFHTPARISDDSAYIDDRLTYTVDNVLEHLKIFIYNHPALQSLHTAHLLSEAWQEKIDQVYSRLDKLEEAILWHPNSKNANDAKKEFEKKL